VARVLWLYCMRLASSGVGGVRRVRLAFGRHPMQPPPPHLMMLAAPAPGMVIQYQTGHVHRALCLEPVGSEGIPGTPSGRSSIVQTSPAKYNPFPRSALSLNTKFVNNFFYSQK